MIIKVANDKFYKRGADKLLWVWQAMEITEHNKVLKTDKKCSLQNVNTVKQCVYLFSIPLEYIWLHYYYFCSSFQRWSAAFFDTKFVFSFGKGFAVFAYGNDAWRYYCTLPGGGGTILMCWRGLIPTRTENAVIKEGVLCLRYSLSLMRTGGDITFYCIEPQISFPSAWENCYNPVVRFCFLIFTKILVSICWIEGIRTTFGI